MDTSLLLLLTKLIHDNGYAVKTEEIRLQLLSHPSYPSLHAVTGLLSHFGIENLALEVPKDTSTLSELPECFLSTTVKEEYVLVKKNTKSVQLIYGDKTKRELFINEFITEWSGIIAVIEQNKVQKEKKKNQLSSTSLLYFLVAVVTPITFFLNDFTLFTSTHFILSLFGLAICGYIIKHEFGHQSKTLEKLCSSKESTSCDAVLNSNAASVYKSIKLSDVCLVYFGSIVLYWVLSQFASISQSVIIIPTVLAIPATLYSMYYQYVVIGKWCPLCLGIIGVLWSQFFSLTALGKLPANGLEFQDISVFAVCFLLVTSLWSLIKPLFNDSNELGELKISHFKFIRNFELFKAAMAKNPRLDTDLSAMAEHEIVLGNKSAPLKVLLVSNPQCYYCKDAHLDLEKILDAHSQDISATIRFSVDANEPNLGLDIAQRLLEMYNDPKSEFFNHALNEAYAQNANLEKWMDKWGSAKSNSQIETLDHQRNWCIQNGISFTPALYVNGQEFPTEYEREHLTFFVEELIELSLEAANQTQREVYPQT